MSNAISFKTAKRISRMLDRRKLPHLVVWEPGGQFAESIRYWSRGNNGNAIEKVITADSVIAHHRELWEDDDVTNLD